MFPVAISDEQLRSLLREAGDLQADLDTHLSAAAFDGLPPHGPFVLGAMAFRGGAAGGLKHVLGITDQQAGEIVDGLVRHGYLDLRVDPADRRRVRIELTDRGRAVALSLWDFLRTMRWRDFPFRAGDIVVSTPAKSGTTWMQMMCALLILRTADLPASMPQLSPWLDDMACSRAEVFAALAGQSHRRVIKTHTPLSDIAMAPGAPEVTYIVVARHPLDTAISLYHQGLNNVGVPRGVTGHGQDRSAARQWLARWIEDDAPREGQPSSLPGMMWHWSDAWSRRADGVLLFHYEDLSADLSGEMTRLGQHLGMPTGGTVWADLVSAASFERMRAAANRLQPLGPARNNTAFFRRGGSGSGAGLLTDGELAGYQARAAALAPPDLLEWLHRR
ncbi:sulfotransferase domain-containing protein [Streptomyces fuscichromogenes]|uniref:sulfotransferase domain-containing protein n=1 Tax=Streptomyces fuscichromogenes TaxID=1324013 RepID=UPI00382CF4CD